MVISTNLISAPGRRKFSEFFYIKYLQIQVRYEQSDMQNQYNNLEGLARVLEGLVAKYFI